MNVTELLSWVGIALVLLVLLASLTLFWAWRERWRERTRRARQLESVYSARDHRERGD